MLRLINFTNLSNKQLEMVRQWRNNDAVRVWMNQQKIISILKHQEFVRDLKRSKKDKYYLARCNQKNLGVVYFKNINFGKTLAFLGIYLNPKMVGQGWARKIVDKASCIAFEELGLKKIKLEVFKKNKRAIRLYNKLNFLKIQEEGNIITMEKNYEN